MSYMFISYSICIRNVPNRSVFLINALRTHTQRWTLNMQTPVQSHQLVEPVGLVNFGPRARTVENTSSQRHKDRTKIQSSMQMFKKGAWFKHADCFEKPLVINDPNNFIGISENENDVQRDCTASVYNRCHICSSSVSFPVPVLKPSLQIRVFHH